VPSFQVDPSWPKTEGNWIFGSIGGITVDLKNDHVWVLQRPRTLDKDENYAAQKPPAADCCAPAPPVMEFDPEGNFIEGWGGPGPGYDWPDNEHGITIDHKATSGLEETGKRTTKRLWGAYGNKPDDSVARVRRPPFDRPEDLPVRSFLEGPAPQQFNLVHAVLISNDDLVYVVDRSNNWLQVFRPDGTFIKEVFVAREMSAPTRSAIDLAFSPDREQRFLYVSGGDQHVRILDRNTLQVLGSSAWVTIPGSFTIYT
jgi:hypothetical protein